MVLFLLRIHFSLTGLTKQVCQTRQSPEWCFNWDDVADPSLVGEKHAYRQHRFVPTWTLWSERKIEVQRHENKQSESAVATHSWQVLLGIRSRVTKYWLGFMRHFFAQFQGVPETTDANGYQSPCMWSWSKFCYHAKTKAKTSKWCF